MLKLFLFKREKEIILPVNKRKYLICCYYSKGNYLNTDKKNQLKEYF